MNKLLLVLALLAPPVGASTIAVADNNAGGQIKLTDDRCDGQPDMRFAYATAPDGTYSAGCWQVLDDMIFVKYLSGKRRMYDILLFKLVPKADPKTRRSDL